MNEAKKQQGQGWKLTANGKAQSDGARGYERVAIPSADVSSTTLESLEGRRSRTSVSQKKLEAIVRTITILSRRSLSSEYLRANLGDAATSNCLNGILMVCTITWRAAWTRAVVQRKV